MKPKKILLLGATFGTNNLGVGALTAGALTIVLKRHPDADVFFLDYGRNSTVTVLELDGKTISIPLINLRFSKKFYLSNNIVYLLSLAILFKLFGQNARKFLIKNNRFLELIYGADITIAVSGGDSFSDIYGLERLFYVSLPQVLVTLLGNKLFLLPQTIGPFKSMISRLVARYIMNHAEIIYSRDLIGVDDTKELLKLKHDDHKVRFCYDMAFILEPRRPQHIHLTGLDHSKIGAKPLIGLNISGLLYIGGYNRNNMFGLKVDYQALVEEIISYFIEVRKCSVLLVPHVLGDHAESDSTVSYVMFERLKNRYPDSLFCMRGIYDQNEVKYIIGLCDFFIGSRMHSCIAALSQSIPAVAIVYSRKFSGVLQSIGVGHLVVDPRRLTNEEMVNKIDHAFAEREKIESHLQKTLPEVKRKVLNLFDEVS